MTRRRTREPAARRSRATTPASRRGLPWTAEEFETLARLATHRGRVRRALPWDRIEAALPGRSRRTISVRLARLTRRGVVKRGGREWTREENLTLRRLWTESAERTLLAALPRRSWSAIIQHARQLGLEVRVRGLVSIPAAATALGLSHEAVIALAARASIALCYAPHAPTRNRGPVKRLRAARRPRFVDLDALREALEAELERETIAYASQRHGLPRATLARWLHAAEVAGHKLGSETMFDPADVDRVVAAHGWAPGRVPVTEAARRHGLPKTTFATWARAEGHRSTRGRPLFLDVAEADRIVAKHRGAAAGEVSR